MAELRLAGNFIDGTFIFGSFGHLQIVFLDDNGTQLENEVQSEVPDSLLGRWEYPNFTDHTASSNYGIEPTKYAKYTFNTLDLDDRSAENVWDILSKIRDEFVLKGRNIGYDKEQNSNSYVTTLLSIVGIDVNDVIVGATPTEVNEFPGIGVNVLNIEGVAFSLELEGGPENDIFHGGIRNDEFTGNEGDDTFIGGKGNDILEGGEGTDTYIINFGDGLDTIIDSDGLGVIKFGAVIAKGKNGVTDSKDWIQIDNDWIDKQNGFTYKTLEQADSTQDLIIISANGGGIFRIKDWNSGELGITLGESTPPEGPVTSLTIVGDLKPEDFDEEADGVQIEFDDLGNVIVTEEEELDRVDILLGSADNDLIQSLGGNDTVDGKAGDDRIEGGAGQDRLDGGLGNDILLGGTDNDIISGHENDDRLYAETEYTIDQAYTVGETQDASGERGSLLDGGIGDDRLFGDSGEDILMGGMGQDIIMGLGGDDTIEGDWNKESTNFNWDVTRDVNTNGDEISYSRTYNFTRTETLEGDNDVIYGGKGEDWIFAQGGNDFIDGGADSDVIFGEAGNDTIFGQSGKDILIGDSAAIDVSLHGDDYLSGGSGDDRLDGGSGSDYLDGGADIDILVGREGNDTLIGGTGADELYGGIGDDVLDGGAGVDILRGGAGNDTYVDVGEDDDFFDLEGKNTIQYADASGVSTDASSPATWSDDSLSISLDNGTTLDLIGALYGMNANIQFVSGASIDVELWVGENLIEPVVLNLGDAVLNGELLTNAYGGAGDDLIQGSAGDDTIKGQNGNDYLLSESGHDVIEGGLGDDHLFGGAGADTLQGGLGSDRHTGGSGADIYVFNLGDGADTITSASIDDAADDEVHLGEGITASDLRFFQLADDSLLMRISGTQDSILLDSWYAQGANVKAIRLHDNSLITASEMEVLAVDVYGGTDGDDVLIGTTADDRIEGYAGDDVLDGAAGNDTLTGGEGHDTYLFGWDALGDDVAVESSAGTSTIMLTGGATQIDLQHARTGNDLVLALRGGSATLTLEDYYVSSHTWTILDETNVTIDVADWLALPQPAVDITQLEAEFLDAVRAQWAADLLSTGTQYTQVDASTYRHENMYTYTTSSSGSFAVTDIKIKNLTSVDYIDDSADMQRQSDSQISSSTTVNLTKDTSTTNPPVAEQFIPLAEIPNWIELFEATGLGVTSINGMIPVYSGDVLIGYRIEEQVSTGSGSIQNYRKTTTTTDTQVEHIQGGDSDNVVRGYIGNGLDKYISIIDGGGGDDVLYASSILIIDNYEARYNTDTEPFIGGFAYGNNGNDTLYGGYYRDTLVGGNGNDYLDGGFSQDTYVMLSGELGVDTIWDTGTQLTQFGFGNGSNLNGFYIPYATEVEVEPIAQDMLRLEGITQEEITYTWDELVVEGLRNDFVLYTQTMHAALTLAWTGGGVEIILPNSTDLPGMGLELIQIGGRFSADHGRTHHACRLRTDA